MKTLFKKWFGKQSVEEKRKELVEAAYKLEAKADPTLPKKTLPKNRAVK